MSDKVIELEQNVTEYRDNGYTLLKGVMSPEVASNMTFELQRLISQVGPKLLAAPRVGNKPAYEVYGYRWWPMACFHFGLTSYIERLSGVSLAPTYSFFRSYQQGDVCRVHADRAACEHSMSLTLAYADNIPWSLSMDNKPLSEDQYFKVEQTEDYEGSEYSEVPMSPGDAVLYKGICHRHGRLLPNPNKWSAHMFLHWVERDGPYMKEAYDGNNLPEHQDFVFPA